VQILLSYYILATTPLERTASSSLLTKVEKHSLRRVEVEVHVRLRLGESLAEIGWVIAGVVSMESPLAHSRQNLEERTGHSRA